MTASDEKTTSVSISAVLDRPAAEAWALVGDFCAVASWLPGIARVEREDDGKRRRIVLPDGAIVLEQEVARDEGAMTLTYVVIESPMPFADYRSTIEVRPEGERCSVCWRATFTPLGPADKVARLVGRLYQAGLEGLRARLCAARGSTNIRKPTP